MLVFLVPSEVKRINEQATANGTAIVPFFQVLVQLTQGDKIRFVGAQIARVVILRVGDMLLFGTNRRENPATPHTIHFWVLNLSMLVERF